MKNLLAVVIVLLAFNNSYAQKTPKKYPSLLWEITGNGLKKPSYLFRTMHVSSKMVFHLSDSFYLAIKNADVVALETDMGTWQEDFSRYDLQGPGTYGYFNRWRNGFGSPSDYLNISTLQFPSYEKMIELALYNSPSMINNFLYRSNSDQGSDFEEDTYLDMHIYQAGKKWGKRVCGVEDFDRSMALMKEAYVDAAKEKEKKQRTFDYDDEFSYGKLEDAYRTGNLDLLDTINKVNSTSSAFDEKFLYVRNEIQARSMDSIMKANNALFAGVGAAHLPGQRGVIELLRKKGYRLRPIRMSERDSREKDEVEKIRVPVQFSRQVSSDGFFSVSMPGKLYDFNSIEGMAGQQQFADMSNGSYYMVTRINTNSMIWGHNETVVLRKIDSVIYENIPGKILSKTAITKNGYKGFEVMNRTRRGDFQRYNIFVTPFEILLFKMSGNGEYVKEGKEADQFFNSIQLKEYKTDWKKWSPSWGGFEVELPHEPVVANQGNWQFIAIDKSTETAFEVIRTDIHNYDFVEEDSFDLDLMEESFSASEFIERQISRKRMMQGAYPALDTKYKYKDGSVADVRFLIQGTHYYTLVAHGRSENPKMTAFLNSFTIRPVVYGPLKMETDTLLYFTVKTPVPLEKAKKISLVPENVSRLGDTDEEALVERGTFRDRTISFDSTGEKIYVSFNKLSRYYYNDGSQVRRDDSTHFKTDKLDWTYRKRKNYALPDSTKIFEYVIGDPRSSRYVQGKLFSRDGVSFRLETEGDTASQQSAFVKEFFSSFAPADTVIGIHPKERKTGIFFSDFFSSDSMLHKKAVHNVNIVDFDSADLPLLKKAIGALNWKEKKYMDVKKDFVWQLASVPTRASADYLKEIYFAAADTVDLQYMALKALLKQKTSYAYGMFRDIMVTDPPVLDLSSNANVARAGFHSRMFNSDFDDDGQSGRSGYFFDDLSDSALLTAAIFKDLLPLIKIHDYEQPMMELMGNLIDSNLIHAKDYESYLPKFLIEAKQQLKKQVISEKNKSIEKAQEDESSRNIYRTVEDEDNGNATLNLYATLLLPFWDSNPAVEPLVRQLLASNDKRLKFNTTVLLLTKGKAIPDTMLNYFAAMDDYRYELYSTLLAKNILSRFPAAYSSQEALARSKLLALSSYDKPDSVSYLDKLPLKIKGQNGFVYFFRYKQKKQDNYWKIASVGLLPENGKQLEFTAAQVDPEDAGFDFTALSSTKLSHDEPVKEQLKKALKKLVYSKRNSAAEFYADEDRANMNLLKGMNFRD